MLRAFILSLIIATTSLTLVDKANAASSTFTKEDIQEYEAMKKLVGEARYVYIDKIAAIGHREDQKKAIKLFDHANKLFKTLAKYPTDLEVAKINTIIENFNKIEYLFREHYGKKYIEI